MLDTDHLAHSLMRKGTMVHEQVVRAFGPDVLSPEGEIDRRVLGRRVFADRAARDNLNRMVHPAVIQSTGEWVREQRGRGRCAAVLVPLLYETGWTRGWDAVLCIASNEETVFNRLASRGLSRCEAEQRIAAQMPLDEKCAQADWVIYNEGSLEELHEQIRRGLEKIRKEQRKQDE